MGGTDLRTAYITALLTSVLALEQVFSLTKDVLHVALLALAVETDPDVIRVLHF